MSLESEAEILLKQKCICPVCSNQFINLKVKAGKTRRIGQGAYLRPIYNDVVPIKYDVIMCPYCGYSAMARYFDQIVPAQKLMIREKILSLFQPVVFSDDAYTYDEVYKRYKMALLCDVTGNVEESRIAYTCLKLAWIVRARIEDPDGELYEEEEEEQALYEVECVKNAFKHFMNAIMSEDFPMCGMDEPTVSYLIAELGYGSGNYKDAVRMLTSVVSNRDISPRLKDKAYELKIKISKKLEELEKEEQKELEKAKKAK